MGGQVPLLVSGEPVQWQTEALLIVCSPPVCILHSSGHSRLFV